jgi:hypothetical protein
MRLVHLVSLPAALCAAALLSIAGCGSDPDPPPPTEEEIDMAAYFGLEVGRCYEYTTADVKQDVPALGVVVEKIDTVQFPVPTYVLAYGTPNRAMEDYVAFDGNELKLYKRSFPGGKESIYDPPLTLMKAPVVAGARLTSSGTARVWAGGQQLSSDEHELVVSIFQPTELSLPIDLDVTGYKVSFEESATVDGSPQRRGRAEVRTIVPGLDAPNEAIGWVKIEMNFHPTDETRQPTIYKLQAVRTVGGEAPACGFAP